jgi:hypothetical protein
MILKVLIGSLWKNIANWKGYKILSKMIITNIKKKMINKKLN